MFTAALAIIAPGCTQAVAGDPPGTWEVQDILERAKLSGLAGLGQPEGVWADGAVPSSNEGVGMGL